MKSCIVCKEDKRLGLDYQPYRQICNDCLNAGLRRCRQCDKVKHESEWYKSNKSGACVECFSFGRRRPGFQGLPKEAQDDILEMLRERELFKESGGKLGKKMTNVAICFKHKVDPRTFCVWLKKGLVKEKLGDSIN